MRIIIRDLTEFLRKYDLDDEVILQEDSILVYKKGTLLASSN